MKPVDRFNGFKEIVNLVDIILNEPEHIPGNVAQLCGRLQNREPNFDWPEEDKEAARQALYASLKAMGIDDRIIVEFEGNKMTVNLYSS